MQTVPLAAVPSQTLSIALDGQAVQMALYQRGSFDGAPLYLDLTANGVPIISGRLVRAFGQLPDTAAAFMLVGRHYQPFSGDLVFIDTQPPTQDPQPLGLGTRWQLLYLSKADLEGAGLVQ